MGNNLRTHVHFFDATAVAPWQLPYIFIALYFIRWCTVSLDPGIAEINLCKNMLSSKLAVMLGSNESKISHFMQTNPFPAIGPFLDQ